MKLTNPIIILAFHLLIMVLLVIWGWHAAMGDWGNYYYGATALKFRSEARFWIYDPTYFNSYVDSWHGERSFLSYTQVPPLSMAIYYPFTLMKVGLAKLVFTLFSYFICVFSIGRLFKKLQIDLRWSLLLPLLFFLPFRSNIDSGQSYFLLIALLAGGWLAKENGKWIFAAFLFALAIHLKIFPAIVLIWFMAEKDWKMFGATIGATLLFSAVSLPFIDWEIWKNYCVEILPRLAKGEINNTFATSYQSMQVLLKQVSVPDAMHNPNPAFDAPVFFYLLNFLWTGAVLVIAFLFSFDRKQNSFLRFSIWIFAGMLISGYGSTYGLLLLIFPAIAIIQDQRLRSNKKIILLLLVGLICNIPVWWIMQFPFPVSFLRLIITLLFFVLLISAIHPQWNKVALIAMLIPLLSLINAETQEEGSNYFLKKEPSLLVTGFRISGDTVKYIYRDDEGLHQAEQLFPEHIESISENTSSRHFAFWGVDYRFPGEQISNVYVINKKYLLYLSDKNRGPGFNTIRIKELDPHEQKKRVRELFQK
jgi:hypothetical protein